MIIFQRHVCMHYTNPIVQCRQVATKPPRGFATEIASVLNSELACLSIQMIEVFTTGSNRKCLS